MKRCFLSMLVVYHRFSRPISLFQRVAKTQMDRFLESSELNGLRSSLFFGSLNCKTGIFFFFFLAEVELCARYPASFDPTFLSSPFVQLVVLVRLSSFSCVSIFSVLLAFEDNIFCHFVRHFGISSSPMSESYRVILVRFRTPDTTVVTTPSPEPT